MGYWFFLETMEKLTISDNTIIAQVCKGDKEKYSGIIKRYEKKLLRYATYLLQDEHDSKDVVQESFIKAYISLNGFNNKKSFSSWIYRIVHNEAINLLKKHKKKISLDEDYKLESGENLEEIFVKKSLQEQTKNCVLQMPIIYREPISLFYLEDKKYEEISDILKIPTNTVATRINRAKGILKQICQKNKIL